MFSIGIGDKNIKLNNSIFTFNANLITINVTSIGAQVTLIPLRPCKYEDYNFDNNDGNQSILQNYICPDNSSYGIYGSFPNSNQYIHIIAEQCKNDTNPYITCASQDYIANYLKNTSIIPIVFIFMNRIINLENVKSPFNTFPDLQFWLLNPADQLRPTTNIYLRANDLTSYDDILGISSPNLYNFITYEKERTDSVFSQTTNTNTYFQLKIYSSTYKNHYTRTYDTFLSVFSYISIGGISNLLIMFAGVIVGFYNGYKYKMIMFNKLYDFDLKEYTMKNNHQASFTKQNKSHELSNKAHENLQKYDNPIIKQKLQQFQNIRSRLTFTVREFFQYISYCCKLKLLKTKLILFNQADNQFSKDMDIIGLIKNEDDHISHNIISCLDPETIEIFECIEKTKNDKENIQALEMNLPALRTIKNPFKKSDLISKKDTEKSDNYIFAQDLSIPLENIVNSMQEK